MNRSEPKKNRKLKMNQRTEPPIAGGNPKQRRTQGGGGGKGE